MKISAWISAALVAVLFASGPLAPMAAFAQARPAVDPPLTSQKPGQERVPVDPVEKMLMPAVDPITNTNSTAGDAAGAAVMNVVFIPGKVIICSSGFVASSLLMLITFGSAYSAARSIFLEGCAAPWALTADYVSGKIPGPGDPGYDPVGRN